MRRFSSLIRKHPSDDHSQQQPLAVRSMSPTDLDDARFMPTPYATHSRRATVASMPTDPLADLERELAATSIRRSASHSHAIPPAPPSYTIAIRENPQAVMRADSSSRRSSSSRSAARAPLPAPPQQAIDEETSNEYVLASTSGLSLICYATNVLRALSRYDIVFLVDEYAHTTHLP